MQQTETDQISQHSESASILTRTIDPKTNTQYCPSIWILNLHDRGARDANFELEQQQLRLYMYTPVEHILTLVGLASNPTYFWAQSALHKV